MWEIAGVEYVYAIVGRRHDAGDRALQGGRGPGGERERRCTRSSLRGRTARRRAPLPPLVKPHSIDDVPILALTLHSCERRLRARCAQVAVHLEDEIRTVPDVADDPPDRRRAARSCASRSTRRGSRRAASRRARSCMALRGANARLPAGEFASGDRGRPRDGRRAAPHARRTSGRRRRRRARRRAGATCATWPTCRDGAGEATDYVGARRAGRARASRR